MKLYNLFEEVIFEEKKRYILSENVSVSQVEDAIKNKYHVWILYDDYPNEPISKPPSERYIEIYALGDTTSGNKVIRAWQMGGPSKTTRDGAFKLFRLDRIRGWKVSKVKWDKSISDLYLDVPKVNKFGDKSMKSVDMVAQYKEKPVTPTQTKTKSSDRLEKLQQASIAKNKSSYTAKGNPNPKTEKTNSKTNPKSLVNTNKTTSTDTSKTSAKPIDKNEEK